MKYKSLLVLVCLALLSTGCSMLSSLEVAPQKVQAKKPPAKKAPPAPVAKKPAPTPGTGTATYAIEDGKSQFKVESTMPTFQDQPITAPTNGLMVTAPQAEQVAQAAVPAVSAPAPAAIAATPAGSNLAMVNPIGTAAAAPAAVASAPVSVATLSPASSNLTPPTPSAPVALQINLEDAAVPAGTSPAVLALISQADASRSRGDLDGAVVVMERALRIDSRNPTLTYKLALLRLRQNKPQLAEDLAGKAALLAGSNLDLKRKSWLLIADARQNQQNLQGAKEAKLKAESFFGR